jgi:hypothetical protein
MQSTKSSNVFSKLDFDQSSPLFIVEIVKHRIID